MAGLSPKQRGAFFEKLKKTGKLTPSTPKVQTPLSRIAPNAPAAPLPQIPGLPKLANPTSNPNIIPGGMNAGMGKSQVNQNYVGAPKSERFKKVKKMFGL